ncbi:MAG: hypothetical protein HC853_15815 [Anaerolineae bacterium]|nr:hypothetical protein [Anaerolineae bacterium]
MSTATIPIQLDADAAQIYQAKPQKEQAKIRLLFSLLLREFSDSARSLEAIMDEIGAKAAAMGLTEEKLQAMLKNR